MWTKVSIDNRYVLWAGAEVGNLTGWRMKKMHSQEKRLHGKMDQQQMTVQKCSVFSDRDCDRDFLSHLYSLGCAEISS